MATGSHFSYFYFSLFVLHFTLLPWLLVDT